MKRESKINDTKWSTWYQTVDIKYSVNNITMQQQENLSEKTLNLIYLFR